MGQKRITLATVREYGTRKQSKFLKFIHAVPPAISTELEKWIAVTKTELDTSCSLFFGKLDLEMSACEAILSASRFPLTVV